MDGKVSPPKRLRSPGKLTNQVFQNPDTSQALGITFRLSVRLRCLHQDDKWEVNRNSNYLQTPAKVRTFTQTNYVTVQKEVRDSKLALVGMSDLKEKRI